MSVIFPKILRMEEFGYWQLFLFYSSFVGFFHFGFNDGVYLRYGGKKLLSLNKELIKSQFLILFFFQVIIGLVLFFYQCFFGRKELTEIVIFVLLFMIINNLSSFMTSLFQSVNKLNFFSVFSIINQF